MDIKRCDLCGRVGLKGFKQFSMPRYIEEVYPTIDSQKVQIELGSITTDLCENCQKKIANMFKDVEAKDLIGADIYYKEE